jgi:NADH-quinone oxidoreductase subunit J
VTVAADLVFYVFAALAVISGCFVVASRNIVHAGFSLLFTLLGVAGLYGSLGADFVAVAQILVYIGGVLVLVLFTVMMTRMPERLRRRSGLDLYVPAGIFAVAVFAVLYRVITAADWGPGPTAAPQPTIAEIGTNFMTDYIMPFEYVSIALLVAMIGAAILIRERKLPPPTDVVESAAGDGEDDSQPPRDGAGAEPQKEEVRA